MAALRPWRWFALVHAPPKFNRSLHPMLAMLAFVRCRTDLLSLYCRSRLDGKFPDESPDAVQIGKISVTNGIRVQGK
jgi:hypothetical protein